MLKGRKKRYHHGRLQDPIQTLQAIRFVLNQMLGSTPSEASAQLRQAINIVNKL
ncbi:hypothetical protein OLMES_4494 [Oleiphilus messinensis]|uniref:Uncharacterized protein n=1 Tax=Oleiphilus messinensis TaxID=141451 RepID=A0A1Y0IDZ6_9GAMM|nr:hypothetical protein OLMES_4494 [Oleiphilus messinensis]